MLCALPARSVMLNQYGSGNVSVEVGTDTVTWAGYKLPKVSLGAATSETKKMKVGCSYVVSLLFANHPFVRLCVVNSGVSARRHPGNGPVSTL